MLKSTKVVLSLGLALGASVAVLPTRSFAAMTIVTADAQVEATVAGVVGFSATSHTTGSETTYSNNIYSGTFRPHEYTDNFGTTTYEVLCNYRSANYSGKIYYDSDRNGTFDAVWRNNGVDVTPANADCSQGWRVQAKAASGYVSGGNAVLTTSGSPAYTIPSTAPTSTASYATSSSANWGMKIAGVGKTVSGATFTPSPASGFNVFHLVPGSTAADVVSGNTFQTVSGVANTYIGTESFQVTYGFNAGMAVAGTYTGQVEYTLYIGN